MRATLLIALQQVKLLSKSPAMLALFVAAPLGLIFVFGQAFSGIFAASGPGIRAIDYFGATLLTLSVFQGTFIASWGISKERKSNTATRLTLAPLPPLAPAVGAFLGSWLILLALSCAVALLSRLLLSVEYGNSPELALAALACESCLAAALGVSLTVCVAEEKAANAIMNTLVPLLVFLGGGYTLIPETGFLHDVSYISPIRWINLALIGPSGSGDSAYLGPAALYCVAASALLLALAALKSRRQA